MNKMNGLHHVKEHPKISNLLQFESHSSKSFKVRAISDLRVPASLSCIITFVQVQRSFEQYYDFLPAKNQSCKLKKLESSQGNILEIHVCDHCDILYS